MSESASATAYATSCPPRASGTRSLVVLLLIVALAVVGVGLKFGSGTAERKPLAVQGELDLRGIDLSQGVKLSGEWLFYWRRFVEPELFSRRVPPPSDAYLRMPKSWKGASIDGQILDEQGYATLALRLRVDSSATQRLGVRLSDINAAYRLWANGVLLAEAGAVGTSAEEERAVTRLLYVDLPAGVERIDLVLHTSNFHPQPYGVTAIEFGPLDSLRGKHERKVGVALFVAGALLLMGIYHLALYLFWKRGLPPLYFGLYALFWMVNVLFNADWPVQLIWPDVSGEFVFRGFRLSLLLATALSYQFFRSLYPDEFPRWFLQLFWAVTLASMALAAVAPVSWVMAALPFYYPLNVFKMLLSFWGLVLAVRRQKQGAFIILVGYVLFCLFGLNDMLFDMGVIRTVLVMHFGMLIFMVAQALALAQRFSSLFASVESLSGELQEKNRTLRKEVDERISVQNDIVALSESERSRISHELHDGLCQQLTGARLLCLSLAGDMADGSSDRGQERQILRSLTAVLNTSVEHAYDLSRGLWPVEQLTEDVFVSLGDLVGQLSRPGAVPVALELRRGACGNCVCANTVHVCSIAREAIVNAEKHARASRIAVRLECRERSLSLTVDDDGVGWVSGRKTIGGLGLRIMAYRARMVGGSFSVEPRSSGGLRALCSMPCASDDTPACAAAARLARADAAAGAGAIPGA